ncbi:molybdate ABC transporter substrate-binding protein [Photobacterium sp. SDRW27]|uniref:molybdate ABC transporter substrate-binding protein n=1 Tax=Photobacterium obscurum TaxID=2829490 RepID=UPI002244D0C8|nr:molybdate ABC transporter substrate-binding protein [Photobacterium obscurum]MCW8330002.1 molybdate ABC transporter substrate-binding protein [Photobacterium obscurum]
MKRLWIGSALVGSLFLAGTSYAAEGVTVFAASSLTNAMNDVAKAYEDQTGVKATLSYASSSALARQIAQGAPADIYLSANEKWMDYVEQQSAVEPSSRKTLLQNSLVLVAPNDYPQDEVKITASWDLGKALQGTRLAMGDPRHVPAGIYAKESLEALGLWEKADRLLARANNVRSALLLVERQEAMLGVVYKTDALISKKVKIVNELPNDSHTPISYPVAIVKDKANKSVDDFYKYLQSDQAQVIFEKYGFGVN